MIPILQRLRKPGGSTLAPGQPARMIHPVVAVLE